MSAVALYARVSSEQQAQRTTIASQLEALMERVRVDGHQILPGNVYQDDGYSGTTLLRPALEQLRDRIAQGEIQWLYVQSPDRLARRYAYQVLLLEEFAKHGTHIVFVQGAGGNSPEQQLLTQVQGMLAEYERALLLERCRRGRIHRAKQGQVQALAAAPYGYRYVPSTPSQPACYQILLPEARVVRRIFHAVVVEQMPVSKIAQELTEAKIPTRHGRPSWHRSTLCNMLRNPAYAGRAAYCKTERVTRQQPLHPARMGSSTSRSLHTSNRRRPISEWIHIPVPAIVQPELFDAAQEQLARNQQLSQRHARGQLYLLQGLLVCACCGHAWYGKCASGTARKMRIRPVYYRCPGRDGSRVGGQRICSVSPMRADRLEASVWASVCTILRDPERVAQEWSRRLHDQGTHHAQQQQHEQAVRQVKQSEQVLQRLLDAYEAGAMELSDLTQRTERVGQALHRARKDLAEVEASCKEAETLQAVITQFDTFADRVRQSLEHLDWTGRRDLIRLLVSRVELDEEGATIVYRLPATQPSENPDRSNTTSKVANTGAGPASCPLRLRQQGDGPKE
jgi:site-specific DNA recombinase